MEHLCDGVTNVLAHRLGLAWRYVGSGNPKIMKAIVHVDEVHKTDAIQAEATRCDRRK